MIDMIAGIVAGEKAADAQSAANDRAMAISKEMFEKARADNAPWREAGTRALGKMEDADYYRDFTQADFQVDPGYMFRMQEGQKALERSAAARGGLMGGGFAKELTRYGQGVASQEYQNAYDRFNADRDRRFGRLSTISGQGQNAAGMMAGQAMQYGNQAAQMFGNQGDIEAARWTNRANAVKEWQANDRQMAAQAGSMFMMCDARLKKDIRVLDPKKVRELRRTLRPCLFRYINEKHGKGEFIGPMAQDLEKSEYGREMVTTDAQGNKIVDLHRVLIFLLALEAEV